MARVGRELEPVLRGLHARTRMLGIRNACDNGWPMYKTVWDWESGKSQ